MVWKIEFTSPSLADLEKSMQSGYIIELAEERADGREYVALEKAAFSCLGGLRMHIYADEHPPPHFHVTYNGEENSFRIDDASPLYPNGDLKKWFKNIKKWHKENKDELVLAWNRMRPEDCPVGVII